MKLPGIAQWFRMGEKNRVEQAIQALNALSIREFRILFSWADWESEGGPEWFDYHVNEIASKTRARLFPVLSYTPPHKARKLHGHSRTSHPPQRLGDYAAFTEEMIERYGEHFDWLQLWNEPNWKPYWEWDLDPDAACFSEMALGAAYAAHEHGKKVVLGGLSPYEPEWITLIHGHGLLHRLDAVGMHYSPSWDDQRRKWYGWETEIETARAHLRGLGSEAEVWIDEAGYSTLPKEPDGLMGSYRKQMDFFDDMLGAPADRIFWFSLLDQESGHLTDNEINMAGRKEAAAYHFGIISADGTKKPLYEHWRANV